MDDEPLSEWADRRDAKIGRLRAIPLIPGNGPQAKHLNPDAPRLIQRWNGHTWEAHGFAANLTETKHILYPTAQKPPTQTPTPNPMRAGTGRHRKPQTPGPDTP